MNLTEFRAEVSSVLSLNLSDATELARIDQWINDGVVEVLGETGSKVTSTSVSLTAGTGDYSLSATVMRLVWVQNSDSYELQVSTPDEIRRKRLNAASDVTREYALDGSDLLMVYPTPSANATLTVYYVPRPAVLATGADTPSELPAEFHRCVALYALWRGADYDDDQSSAQGTRYAQMFEQELARCRKRLNMKGGRKLAPARVSTRVRVPSRNDIV